MPNDTEIIDWLERQNTMHRTVEVFYAVCGYVVSVQYDGNDWAGPWEGETLREAYANAMKEWDVTHGDKDLLLERTGRASVRDK